MPSAKNSKSSNVHHPPTNRAFALRMMNSSQNTEGRVSPFDKALKPFRDSFKKSSKSKKAKEKSSPAATDSHSDLESRDEESFDSTYEVSSPTYDNHQRGHDTLPWTSQARKGHSDDRQNYKSVDSVTASHGYRSQSNPHADYDHANYHQRHLGHRGMADILEEDEFYSENEKSRGERERLGHYRYENGRHQQRGGEQMNGKGFYHRDTQMGSFHRPNEYQGMDGNFHETENDSSYFVAPNGEMVKLREKKNKNTEHRSGREQNSQLEALLPERFGKRLSMLCHMLAEKYPEDFHILELLVELQVSNEKREEEMNKSVNVLKKKVELMEDRLLNLERQSTPGFREMLLPLAAAAEAFNNGVQKSLSGYLRSCEKRIDKNTPCPSIEEKANNPGSDVRVSKSSTVNCNDASSPETEREGLNNLKGEEETSVTIYNTKDPEPEIADVTESESIKATKDHEEQSKDRSKGIDEERYNKDNQSVTDEKFEASSQENTNGKTEEGIIVSAEEITNREKGSETEGNIEIRNNGQDAAVQGNGIEDLGKAENEATDEQKLPNFGRKPGGRPLSGSETSV